MNINDVITRQARIRPHAVAMIRAGGALVSYELLERLIGQFAEALYARGVLAGQVVGVAMLNHPAHLITLFALARLGAVSVAVHPALPAEQRARIVSAFGVRTVISDGAAPAPEGCAGILATELESGPRAVPPVRPAGDGRDTWRISLTSGSTGAPKGVQTSHALTLQLLQAHQMVAGIRPESRFLASMDLNVNIGLTLALRHLLVGSTVVFPARLANEHYVEAIDRYAITHMMTSPLVLQRLVESTRGEQVRFPSLRHVSVAGGALPRELRRAAYQRITPHLYTYYGTNEVGLVAVGEPELLWRRPEAVGVPVPGIDVQVVDAQDAPVPAGTVGALRIRGPHFPTGYLNAPDAEGFRDGWYYPGDLAMFDADGLLSITGRSDELINVRGNKVQPGAIEEALLSHAAVSEAVCFGLAGADGGMTLCAAVVRRAEVAEAELISACAQRLGNHLAPSRIFFVQQMPRNSSDKPLRGELAQQAAAGTLQ